MQEKELEREPIGQCDECKAWSFRVTVLRIQARPGMGVKMRRIERIEFECEHQGSRAGER